MSLGAQAEELLDVIERAWGRHRRDDLLHAAEALSRELGDPRKMTRNYHVYLAGRIPMPAYVLEEFAWFLKRGTEKDARRKMTPRVRAWLLEALAKTQSIPTPPG